MGGGGVLNIFEGGEQEKGKTLQEGKKEKTNDKSTFFTQKRKKDKVWRFVGRESGGVAFNERRAQSQSTGHTKKEIY